MHTTSTTLIQIEGLTHRYTPEGAEPVEALRGIDLAIQQGEFVALVGANGSGKSTLARHLNALLLPTEGRVLVNGLDTRDPPNHRDIRSTVGMVFQIPIDQIVATIAEEDVAFGPENLGIPQPELGERVQEALQRVSMWQWRERPPHLLSPGQQQRLAIAGILAMRPQCLILDEATAMLDPQGRRDLWDIVHGLRQDGMTVLFITHDMDEAAQAGRIVALHRGRIALDGPPKEVFADEVALSAIGLSLPSLARLGTLVRSSLPDVGSPLLSIDELAAVLRQADR